MSGSTTILDTISENQSSKATAANELFDAASPATLFGRRASTSTALTWGYYGGSFEVDGVYTAISNGTLALSASTTNYIEVNRSGTVSKNTTGFTAGSYPLYTVVTGASTVSSYTDHRLQAVPIIGKLALAMGDANTTLSAAQSRNKILEFTGALTAQRNIVLPLGAQQWTVFNNTTGGFGLQFIGASGTGTVVAASKRAIIYSDGTNVVRASADV